MSAQAHLLPLAVFLAMVTVGLELKASQFRALLAAPRGPVVGTLIHTLTFPLVAVAVVLSAQTLGLEVGEATLLGVLLIAACPSGGYSNVLTLMAGGNLPLSVMLTALSSLGAVVTLPLLLGAFGWLMSEFSEPVAVPVAQLLQQLVLLMLLPLLIGMAVTAKVPGLTMQAIQRWQRLAQLLLYGAVAFLIVENIATVKSGLAEAVPRSVALCLINTGLCLTLALRCGLAAEDAITVALEAAVRNGGVALAIAVGVFGRMDVAVMPTV